MNEGKLSSCTATGSKEENGDVKKAKGGRGDVPFVEIVSYFREKKLFVDLSGPN